MSLWDPLQWVVIGLAVVVILSVIAGVLLRFYRALTGTMPQEGSEEAATAPAAPTIP